MSFLIGYDKQPQRFLKKLDKHMVKRIMDKVDMLLVSNPVPHNAKTIVGEHGVIRIRIGDYRVLYRIDYGKNKIIIFKINKRPRIYQK